MIDTIARAVSEQFDIPLDYIFSDRKGAVITRARFAAFYIAKKTTDLSYPALGRFFGKDHTTVMHGVKRANKIIREDLDFARNVDICIAELSGWICKQEGQNEKARGIENPYGRFHFKTRHYHVSTDWCWRAIAALHWSDKAPVLSSRIRGSQRPEEQQIEDDMIFVGAECKKCGGIEKYKDGKCRPCKVARQAAARHANGCNVKAYRNKAGNWKEAWGTFEDDPRACRPDKKRFFPKSQGQVLKSSTIGEVAG